MSFTNTQLGSRRSNTPSPYRRRKARQARRRSSRRAQTLPRLADIVDVGNLQREFYRMKRENGQAPGPDGMR